MSLPPPKPYFLQLAERIHNATGKEHLPRICIGGFVLESIWNSVIERRMLKTPAPAVKKAMKWWGLKRIKDKYGRNSSCGLDTAIPRKRTECAGQSIPCQQYNWRSRAFNLHFIACPYAMHMATTVPIQLEDPRDVRAERPRVVSTYHSRRCRGLAMVRSALSITSTPTNVTGSTRLRARLQRAQDHEN
ncbi:hypothetical protein F4777DRAFT_396382 [Nemania sp. FL0916]|nr:hypothetical protein F4777DRAFT_396382 [Nemania sp. FL0916]